MADSMLLVDSPEGFNRVKRCRHGYMLYNRYDDIIGTSLDIYGEFSEAEIELFARLIKPGSVVLDIGANIGCHTVWFAQVAGPEGVVLAFEPQRLVYQALCANVALNSLTNVVCHQVAVGETEDEVIVPVLNPRSPKNFGGLEVQGHDEGETVAVLRLDEIPLPSCQFIKVDVEGMELAVLRGGAELIQRHKPILYVENDREERKAELIRYIDSIGYDMYWHKPPLFNPDNYFQNKENIFDRIISLNMFCVPKGAEVLGLEKVEVPA